MIKTSLLLIIFLLTTGCFPKHNQGTIIFKLNGVEIFQSEPIQKATVIDSRLYFDLSENSRDIIHVLASNFPKPVMIDIYFGDGKYTEVMVNFSEIATLDKLSFSIPEISDRNDLIVRSGIRLSR